MPDLAPPPDWRLLLETSQRCAHDPGLSVLVDHIPWGATSRRASDGSLWRAIDDEARGPLLLHARTRLGATSLRAWAPAQGGWQAEDVHERACAWVGLRDEPGSADEVLDGHPTIRELRRRLGALRLSTLPSTQEAVGRAVLGQLVQFREAERSAAQIMRGWGREVGALRTWPTPSRLAAVPAWDLRRRCGVSLRGARSLHAAAMDAAPLERLAAARDWDGLDRRLRGLPGIGVWTSAEARLALGDGDAVPFGDYHLPNLVGHALGEAAPAAGWTDTEMAELLEPFRPYRGRVIRMLVTGYVRHIGPRPERRAPRAAYSAHRYW